MPYSKTKYLFSIVLLVFSYIFFIFFNDFIDQIPDYVYTIFWALFVFDILVVMIPRFAKYTPSGKHLKKFFREGSYKKEDLLDYVKKMNYRALITFVFCLFVLGIIGVLFFTGYIDRTHIFLIVITLNFIDYFSINTWCIFHKIFIRNRCCNVCRIYNWDHFLKFSPLIFIFDFRAWSLFILGLLALIQWEISYALYPERFTDISNENLKCTNCTQTGCRFR